MAGCSRLLIDLNRTKGSEPCQIEDGSDYTVPVHGEARGLDAVLVEVRQHRIAEPQGAAGWAGRLADAVAACRPG